MKIHILYSFQNKPWGGGNQFLKALKKELEARGVYAPSPKEADIILFNSHHNVDEAFKIKKKYKEKIFIHRIDGPLYLTRGRSKDLDRIIYAFNEFIADGTIFQSNWCKEQNIKIGRDSTEYEAVIHNASDKAIFTKQQKTLNPGKIKLIASSWSSNARKGFEIYRYLDSNLDFSRYEMTFVGNSPVEFANIKSLQPVDSRELARILHQHDIYITASQNDPCSNSLIEALSCGLPAVALRDGGHPELVLNGGELFSSTQDVIEKIEKVAKNYHQYQSGIVEPLMEKTIQSYYEFGQKVYQDAVNKSYVPKQITWSSTLRFYGLKLAILKAIVKNKWFSYVRTY